MLVDKRKNPYVIPPPVLFWKNWEPSSSSRNWSRSTSSVLGNRNRFISSRELNWTGTVTVLGIADNRGPRVQGKDEQFSPFLDVSTRFHSKNAPQHNKTKWEVIVLLLRENSLHYYSKTLTYYEKGSSFIFFWCVKTRRISKKAKNEVFLPCSQEWRLSAIHAYVSSISVLFLCAKKHFLKILSAWVTCLLDELFACFSNNDEHLHVFHTLQFFLSKTTLTRERRQKCLSFP